MGDELVSTPRPRRNRRHFADDIFKCIFLNENVLISIKISLKFIPKGPINNIPTLAQIMSWCRPGDKPSSEPMMIISLSASIKSSFWLTELPIGHYFVEFIKKCTMWRSAVDVVHDFGGIYWWWPRVLYVSNVFLYLHSVNFILFIKISIEQCGTHVTIWWKS